MLQFVLTFIFLFALAAVSFIVVRTMPRIDEAEVFEKKNPVERWLASEMPEKLDAAFESFLSKFIRRAKIWTLKTDNRLNVWATKINRPEKKPTGSLPAVELKPEAKIESPPEQTKPQEEQL